MHPPSSPPDVMTRSLVLAAALGLIVACGPDRTDGTVAPPPPEGTPFEYILTFVPRDSIYGESGVVRGVGASWTFGASNAFVMELPATQVSGTVAGGTSLVVALTIYPTTPEGLPQPGQYSIGLATVDFAGRGWLRDPSRVWATNSGGFLIIESWDGDEVAGTVALRVEQQIQDNAGPASTGLHATVSGRFLARRR